MGVRSGWVVCAVLVVAAVGAQPASAQSDAHRWAHISPFYQPKNGTMANVHVTNGDDDPATVNLRRYSAVGGLLSSGTLTVAAKSTVITFAGANSGAQMHVEAWVSSPAVIIEIQFTDPSDVVQRIDSSRWRIIGPEQGVPDAVAGLQETMGELRPPILALGGQFDTVGGKLDALRSGVSGRFDTVGEKLDALQSGVSALGAPVGGVAPQITALAAENAALRKDVRRLRRDVRVLRKLIVSRLPPRRAGRP